MRIRIMAGNAGHYTFFKEGEPAFTHKLGHELELPDAMVGLWDDIIRSYASLQNVIDATVYALHYAGDNKPNGRICEGSYSCVTSRILAEKRVTLPNDSHLWVCSACHDEYSALVRS